MPPYFDLNLTGFRARLGGNAAEGEHRSGYNGVWSLVPQGHRESLFVPAYAGLNLEHYFDGWHNGAREIFFEPRVAPMEVERSGESLLLRQTATPFWGVESTTTFRAAGPNTLRMEFRAIPTRRVFNAETLGVFWASYINQPEDPALHFLGWRPGGKVEWIRFASPKHGEASSVRGPADAVTFPVAESQKDKLFSSTAPERWLRAGYYGRWRDQVYLVKFLTAHWLRFAHSPSGGGMGNPAWDFQILTPKYRVGIAHRLQVDLTVARWPGDREGPRWAAEQLWG